MIKHTGIQICLRKHEKCCDSLFKSKILDNKYAGLFKCSERNKIVMLK